MLVKCRKRNRKLSRDFCNSYLVADLKRMIFCSYIKETQPYCVPKASPGFCLAGADAVFDSVIYKKLGVHLSHSSPGKAEEDI